MDFHQIENIGKYVRPRVTNDASKHQLRQVDSTRSVGKLKSLASVRREIHKTVSVEDKALKEGNTMEEQLESTVLLDSYPVSIDESLHSFKAVYEKLKKSDSFKSLAHSISSQTLRKLTLKSVSSEEVKKPIPEAKNEEELVKFLGKVMTDIENLSSIVKIANEFVDDIISESLKIVKIKKEVLRQDNNTEMYIPLKELCQQTEETQKDRPSMFVLANNFVDSILNESLRRAMNLKFLDIDRFQSYSSLDDFKVKDGLEIVAKCMSKWSFNSNWYYRTVYHGRMMSDSHSYFYTVRWSVPTPSYPIAQVNVDVNFTVEVIPLITFPFYIEVWYRVETDRSQHSAFNSQLLEKWLKTIVQRKLKTFKRFNF